MGTNHKDYNESNDYGKTEDLEDLSGTMFESSEKLSAIEPLENALLADPDNCGICGELLIVPRMLHCLHVFCESCLDKKLVSEAGDCGSLDACICCPTCNYVTPVGMKKLAALPLDVTKTNISDVSNATNLYCTSCTAKEVAKSRCSTCHNLLCNNCDTAHHFMRCFESHKVVALDDMRKEGHRITIHKPLECDIHSGENIIYYCNTCNVTACGECAKSEHKNHQYEGILDSENRVRQEMENLLLKSKEKIEMLMKASTGLNSNMEELAHQRSTARDLINESYQSYKAVLEKCRDHALDELNELYHERELKLMQTTNELGKTIEDFEDACKYTARLLETGTVPEMMYLKNVVGARLIKLGTQSPKVEQCLSIEFASDFGKFEKLIRHEFGKFTTESTTITKKNNNNNLIIDAASESIHHPHHHHNHHSATSALSELIPLTIMNGGGGISSAPTTPSILTNGCGIHSNNNNNGPSAVVSNGSPLSMHSSYDGGDLSTSLQNFSMTQSPPPLPPQTSSQLAQQQHHHHHQQHHVNAAASMQGFNSIAEYNLAQLATLAETTAAAGGGHGGGGPGSTTTPPPTPTPTPFTLADILTNDTAYKNLASLAKLGLTAADNGIPNGPSTNNILARSTSVASLNLMNGSSGGGGGFVSASTSPLSLSTPDDICPTTDPLSISILPNSAGGIGVGGISANPNAAAASSVQQQQQSNPSSSAIPRTNKVSPMQIRCKFGQLGPSKGQFNSPHGFCLGMDEDIIVADTNNHRIQVFEKTGTFKFQFGIPGKDEGQLWYPRKVAIMRTTGKYVVCDRGNERSRMQIFTKNGHFLKKIAIRYIDIVAGLAVTATGEIVAVDSVSPTVFIIGESGELMRWFDCSDYMREPSDIAIHGKEFYVCDFKGHNVVVFSDDGQYLRRIGCENLTNFPNGIDISDAGDVLIGDSHGNRFHVAVFSRDGSLISEFECPYVKVSRCCGLKITSEGYIVTLAKNNHHVLVLNTLYIL